MTDVVSDPPPKKRPGVMVLLLSAGLSVLLGAGAFLALQKEMIFPSGGPAGATEGVSSVGEIAFVPLDPMIVSLSQDSQNRNLRIALQLEVHKTAESEVRFLLPRVADVMNSYLQALTAADVEAPAALVLIRAQMLRRAQIVIGEGRVRDLLVSEFVIN